MKHLKYLSIGGALGVVCFACMKVLLGHSLFSWGILFSAIVFVLSLILLLVKLVARNDVRGD